MYWFKAGALADELRAGTLDERQKFNHVLAMMVLFSLLPRAGWLAALLRPASSFPALLGMAISIWGITHCFRVNQRGDGRAFIERFACLGLPVGMVWIALYLTGYAALRAGLTAMGMDPVEPADRSRVYGQACGLVLLPLFYYWMARNMARASGSSAAGVRVRETAEDGARPIAETPAA